MGTIKTQVSVAVVKAAYPFAHCVLHGKKMFTTPRPMGDDYWLFEKRADGTWWRSIATAYRCDLMLAMELGYSSVAAMDDANYGIPDNSILGQLDALASLRQALEATGLPVQHLG